MITTKQITGALEFYWDNGSYMGYAYQEVDGYYVFVFPTHMSGCHTEHGLRSIADKLRELNKDWDNKVNDYFENAPELKNDDFDAW
jgi:hypothetical protein